MTIAALLHAARARLEAAGIPPHDAQVEARLLARHALGLTREQLFLQSEREISPEQAAALSAGVARRATREPLAYIVGTRAFYGRAFTVNPAVLIPRPETELLVETSLRHLRNGSWRRPPQVADIGTGSGCIAISLALEMPEAMVHATDISTAALAVAQANAERHEAAVSFFSGDLLDALPDGYRYHAIVSNPPYIASGDAPTLEPEVRAFEPALALFAPDTHGLGFYRRLAQEAPGHLFPGGALIVEVGLGQADPVATLWERAGLTEIETLPDLAGIARVVAGRKPRGDTEP